MKYINGKSQSSISERVEMDEIKETGKKVILAGFGELGVEVGRFLISAGIKPVILDNDASSIELLKRLGFEVYYGDVTRLDLLEAAGIADAELLINTVNDFNISEKLVELTKKHYPHIKIVSSAKNYLDTHLG